MQVFVQKYESIKSTKSMLLVDFLFAVVCYMILLLAHGYTFGGGDQIELLPYVQWLQNPSLFPKDFFLQSLITESVNIRRFTAQLLLVGGDFIEIWTRALHIFCTVGSVFGLIQLAHQFKVNRWIGYLSVLILLVLLYCYWPGSVALYYNNFQASSLAKLCLIWSYVTFYKNRPLSASILLVFTTIIHPVVGITNVTILAVALGSKAWKHQQFKPVLAFLLPYLIVALPYVIYLWSQHQNTLTIEEQRQYFHIFFEYRHATHFLPQALSINAWAGIVLVFAFGSSWIWKQPFGKSILVTFLLGIIVYYVNIIWIQNISIASVQWYKSGLVLQYLLILGSMVNVSRIIPQKRKCFVMLCIILCLFGATFYRNTQKSDENNNRELYRQIKSSTSLNSVFLVPYSCTDFKYFAARSSWVDYKAIPKQQAMVLEWFNRIQSVYKSDLSFNFDQLELWKANGVTHLLINNEDLKFVNQTPILTNQTYSVIQLQ